MSSTTKYALILAAGFVLGAWLTWWQFRPLTVIESAAPAVRQVDGSLVAERSPGAIPVIAAVPAGTKPVRTAEIRVKAKPAAGSGAGCSCDPVTVNTTLVRERDGAQRLVVSSPDGEVVGAVDSPLEPLQIQRPAPWAAGATYGTGERAGMFLDRDVGPFRVGAEVDQTGGDDWQARVRVGWRF